ncbi:hypothetical protein BBJ29_005185 [Phytophthora kernoviae]|uniref:Uncharacterized protein n=1 Tax=Phytophthora kernoviae TaxID=325452 RepID=A0A3F2RJA7_9STRA|nr:hypothetical protein BBJ29_005185 [Phytophthora kernoviae]RLN58304.1 hypothetical protein BBP00_00007062 [Phytophthora kernoviae]
MYLLVGVPTVLIDTQARIVLLGTQTNTILVTGTFEITADMYAEYIAIGCSQSIVFWYTGHVYYPALQLVTGSEIDVARWRFNQIALLGFQFVVEIFVDYICVVMEIAAGIEFERIKDLSSFLCMLFMTMAVLNISISSTVYLS